MAITKHFKQGDPADDGEITEAATFSERLDGPNAGACQEDRLSASGETAKAYDIKQAVTYEAGVWTLILDNTRDDTLINLKIIVTNAAGAQLRVIHDFGSVTLTGADDVTFASPSKAAQTLTTSERLAVFITTEDANEVRFALGNFSTACDSRLITPNTGADPDITLSVDVAAVLTKNTANPTISITPVTGDTLAILNIYVDDTAEGTVTSVTDDQSQTWTQEAINTVGTQEQYCFTTPNPTATC